MLEQLLPVLGVAFAILGALAKCAQSLIDDDTKKFELKRFILHMIVSVFESILVLLVGYTYHWSYLVVIACCGLAGWCGSKTISVVKNVLGQYWKE